MPPRRAASVTHNLRSLLGRAILGVLLSVPSACDVGQPASSGHAGAPPPPAERDSEFPESNAEAWTPIETIRRLRLYRSTGRYALMEPFLLPEQRSAVIAQIRAVDRLHAAARLLRRRVHGRLGLAAAQEFDYTQVANILGIFSSDVTLLNERLDVDRATISFQVADRVPLDTVEMLRRKKRWLLVCDPIDGVPEELVKLALLLERIADEVQYREITVDELRGDFKLRQTPIMRRLAKLVARTDTPAFQQEPKSRKP